MKYFDLNKENLLKIYELASLIYFIGRAIFKNCLNSFLEIEPEPFAKGGQVCSPQKVDHQYD